MITTTPKLFDLAILNQMNDENFTAQVIDMYLQDTPQDLEDMQIYMDGFDLEAVAGKAHKLKSSTGLLQALHLLHSLEKIEKLAKKDIVSDELINLVPTAINEFDELKKQLIHYLQTP